MKSYGKIINLSAESYEIDVAPEFGFSLIGFRKKGVEILHPGTGNAFLNTRKGYGPLILPHFNQDGYVPRFDLNAFPHVRELEKIGIKHPFQHGVGRYVSWEYSADEKSIKGTLDGSMRRSDITLAALAGFDFTAVVVYTLRPKGLGIAFDIRGEKPIAAGIHFYYNIYNRTTAKIFLPLFLNEGIESLSLLEPVNTVFPVGDTEENEAVCTLKTEKYYLITQFSVGRPEEQAFNSLVIFSPDKADFACIEPVSYVVGAENTKRNFRGKILLSLVLPGE
jgi:galactose mutarotase-like enzyme